MTVRKLGAVAATAIVIANMIGTGVFTSTGFQAASLHDPWTILAAWVVGGVLALAGAACYAELGAMMPRVGGEYVYLREAYHPVMGVMSGWASLFAGFSAPIAAAALAFGQYASAIDPSLADPTTQKMLAVGLVVAMTALHSFDVVLGGRVQTAFTVGQTLLILVFAGAGLLFGRGDAAHFAGSHGGLSNVFTTNFAVALMYVSFAYSGWNSAAYIAGELDRPARTVPRALLSGTAVVMALYLLLNVVFLYALPVETLASGSNGGPVVEVGAATATAMFGGGAGRAVSILIALALVSAVSAMVMAGPRIYAAMAADHALPAVLARRTARGAPPFAVALQGAIAIGIVLYAQLGQVLRYVGFTLAIFAALTVAAVVILRVRRPDAVRPYRTFGYPFTPVLFVGASIWIAYGQISEHPIETLYVLATLVLGALSYAAFGLRRPPGAAAR